MPERIIVNYGVYRFSTEEREAYRIRVFTQLERKPEILYENYKTQKPRSHYGYAQLMWGEWVVATYTLEYAHQLLWEWTNDSGQLAVLIHCLHHVQRDNIVDLSTCIPTCILTPQTFPMFGMWRLPYDRIVFKLHADATVLVNVEATPFQQLCEYEIAFAEDVSVPFEPSVTNVPENPLDPGYDLPDVPYDEPDDNGETYNPQRPVPPIGGESRNYQVTVSVRYLVNLDTGAKSTMTLSYTLLGPVTGGEKQHTKTQGPSGFSVQVWVALYNSNNVLTKACLQAVGSSLTSAQADAVIAAYEILSIQAV